MLLKQEEEGRWIPEKSVKCMSSENECSVTVIIPFFNSARFLRRAIESVLGQSYRNTEVLLVDDGSTDASSAVCSQYAENSKVRLIRLETNRGTAAARNMGLEAARGEFICFLDSDDSLAIDAVEVMVAAAKRSRADVVIGGMSITTRKAVQKDPIFDFGAARGLHVLARTMDSRVVRADELLCCCFLGASGGASPVLCGHMSSCVGRLYRKRILNSGGIRFDESLRVCEDGLFMLECIGAADTLCFITNIVYECHRYPPAVRDHLTGNNYVDFFDYVARYLGRQCALIEKKAAEVPDRVRQEFFHVFVMMLVRGAANMNFLGRDWYRMKLGYYLANPLVTGAAHVYTRTRKSDSRLIPFFFKRGWHRLLYWSLLSRGRQYAKRVPNTLRPASIYRADAGGRSCGDE